MPFRPALFVLSLWLSVAVCDYQTASTEISRPKLGGGSFAPVTNVVIKHEESHLHPTKRPLRMRTGNFQPFPDVVSLSFNAGEKHYSFPDLMILESFLAENATATHVDEHSNEVKSTPLEHRHYDAHYTDGSWVSVTLHSDTEFEATLMGGDGRASHVGTLDSLKGYHELEGPTRQAELAAAGLSGQDMVLIRQDIDLSIFRGPGDNATTTPTRRRLLDDFTEWTGDRWTGCWNGYSTNYLEMGVHAITSYKLGQQAGGQQPGIAYIQKLFAQINTVYRGQLHVSLKLNKVTILSQSDSASYNNCGFSINDHLNALRAYHAQSDFRNNQFGITQVVHECWEYGTVGLAYVGSICGAYGAGINSGRFNGHLWTTAHEIGHNFGGDHSFEEGQGRTGGIMDYGGIKYKGLMQFNTKHREQKMCQTIESARSRNSNWCMLQKSLGGCGNGFVDSGEQCDSNTQCCNNCRFTTGSQCDSAADAECCTSGCKINANCGWCKWSGTGTTYKGLVSKTKSGKTCQKWSSTSPHRHQYTQTFASEGDHNYCRNPGGTESGPWCFTTDSFTRMELCDVGTPALPKCGGAEPSGPTPTPRPPTNVGAAPTAGAAPTRPPPTPAPSCEDNPQYASNCPRWAGAGYCTQSFVAFMERNCQKSCDKCPTTGGGGETTTLTCVTTGGSAPEGSPCYFPFVYAGVTRTKCVEEDNNGVPWCVNAQGQWGNCRCTQGMEVGELVAPPPDADPTESCEDFGTGWKDQDGNTCADYAGEKEWCKNNALHEDRDFFKTACADNKPCKGNGLYAYEACCSCGGGKRAEKVCPILSPPQGTIDTGSCVSKTPGQTCTFTCAEGYVPANAYSTRTCGEDLQWSTEPFECKPLSCPDLEQPANTKPGTCTNKKEGDTCGFECEDGYVSNNFETRTCSSGKWTGFPLLCSKAMCPTLITPHGANGDICSNKLHGETCEFTCKAGYTAGGSATRTCENGVWSGNSTTCTKEGTCPELQSGTGAISQRCVGKKPGEKCKFSCDVGYIMTAEPLAPNEDDQVWEPNTRVCQEDFTWSGEESDTACFPIVCGPLDSPQNAVEQKCEGTRQGESCTFQCLAGYVASGSETRKCDGGVFDGEPLMCSPKMCPALKAPENSRGDPCTGKMEGQQCTFTCKDGFATLGDPTRICINGAWSGFSLACTPANATHVYIATDFGECNAVCGQEGNRTRQIKCLDVETGGMEVPQAKCNQSRLHEPVTDLGCTAKRCGVYKWVEKAWESCSAPCGGGLAYRRVVCETDTGFRVDASYCAGEPKPVDEKACNQEACEGEGNHWVTGRWSECDKPCGDGKRSREVVCRDVDGNKADDTACSGTKPAAEDACKMAECEDLFQWKTCGWDECTAECGGAGTQAGIMAGVTAREVTCVDKTGKEVDEALCTFLGAKPAERQIGCRPEPCTRNNWMTTVWGPCVDGIRKRTVHCHFKDGTNALNEDCPEEFMPILEEKCTPGLCRREEGADPDQPDFVDFEPEKPPTPADTVSAAAGANLSLWLAFTLVAICFLDF